MCEELVPSVFHSPWFSALTLQQPQALVCPLRALGPALQAVPRSGRASLSGKCVWSRLHRAYL